jgi:hypothetical protein
MGIMRVFSFVMPGFALAGGAVGFYLRMVELRDVFDAATGLPERGAVVTMALFALCGGFLLPTLLFSIWAVAKYTTKENFANAYGTEGAWYPTVLSVAGVVWLGATIKRFADLNAAGAVSVVDWCFLIMSALSAVSFALFAIVERRDKPHKATLGLSVIPTLFMCFWLILLYKDNAANPILLSYGYNCLALIAAALGFYFTSGFVFGKPAHGKTILAYLSAVFFGFVTLADDHMVEFKLIIAAFVAINATQSFMLIRNLEAKSSSTDA